MENRIKINDVWYVKENTVEENTQMERPYMLGDKFSLDFDYDGMLECGLEIDKDTHVNILEDLLTSFEDVNYHREAAPLYDLIEHKKYQNEYGSNEVTKENLNESLRAFKKECEDTINAISKGLGSINVGK